MGRRNDRKNAVRGNSGRHTETVSDQGGSGDSGRSVWLEYGFGNDSRGSWNGRGESNLRISQVVRHSGETFKASFEGRALKTVPFDTGKVKIGLYYEPKENHYNPDQDWIQRGLLGVKPDWTYHIDNLIEYVLLFLGIYAVLGLLSRGWYE